MVLVEAAVAMAAAAVDMVAEATAEGAVADMAAVVAVAADVVAAAVVADATRTVARKAAAPASATAFSINRRSTMKACQSPAKKEHFLSAPTATEHRSKGALLLKTVLPKFR